MYSHIVLYYICGLFDKNIIVMTNDLAGWKYVLPTYSIDFGLDKSMVSFAWIDETSQWAFLCFVFETVPTLPL